MKKEKLIEQLQKEVEKWSGKSFDELSNIKDFIAYNNGEGDEFYQVEVTALENKAEYIHIRIVISCRGWTAFAPLFHNIIVHKDGKVEK